MVDKTKQDKAGELSLEERDRRAREALREMAEQTAREERLAHSDK